MRSAWSVAHFGSVGHPRTGRSTWHRLFFVVTASGADDDVLADSDHSESLRAGVPTAGVCSSLCVRPRWQVGAVRLGLDQLGVHDWGGIAATKQGWRVPLVQLVVRHAAMCARLCGRSARDVIEDDLKRPDPYRIALGLLPSPVSCGNKPDRMGALSAGAQFGQHRVTDRRLCLHEAADRTDRAYHPGVHSAPA